MLYRILCAFVLLTALTGCLPVPAQTPDMTPLTEQVDSLSQALEQAQSELSALNASQQANQVAMTDDLTAMRGAVDALPAELARTCRTAFATSPASPAVCEQKLQKVMVKGDTMVVGTQENIWLDPPGLLIAAKIDTGAQSSSVHAANLQEFERDGDAWVRFDLTTDAATHTMERKVLRHVRVVQQADSSGSRRPVVAIRVALGDVRDTFEFTLADRSHLEHQMIIGRNFLTDIALVDVSREFIQPAPADANK